jgi:RNA polymerase sigma factor (sigma-70 family)
MWAPEDKKTFIAAFEQGRHNDCVQLVVARLVPVVRRKYEAALRDTYAVDELVQDLLADVIQSLPKLREPAAVSAWFQTCADNHLSTWLRRKKRGRVVTAISNLDHVVDAKTPRSDSVWNQRKSLLRGIEKLKATDAAIVAFRMAEWPHERIADLLAISVESAKKRYQRAVKTMRATHRRSERS